MTARDLALQAAGSSWIGARDPVDLDTSCIGTTTSRPSASAAPRSRR